MGLCSAKLLYKYSYILTRTHTHICIYIYIDACIHEDVAGAFFIRLRSGDVLIVLLFYKGHKGMIMILASEPYRPISLR